MHSPKVPGSEVHFRAWQYWDGMDFKVVGHSTYQLGFRVLSLKEINVVSSHENELS